MVNIKIELKDFKAVDLNTVVDEVTYQDPRTAEMRHDPVSIGDLVSVHLAETLFKAATEEQLGKIAQLAVTEIRNLTKARADVLLTEILTPEFVETVVREQVARSLDEHKVHLAAMLQALTHNAVKRLMETDFASRSVRSEEDDKRFAERKQRLLEGLDLDT